MLCWMVQKSRTHLTRAQVEHAIKRNFSGYESDQLNPYEIFMSALKMKVRRVLNSHCRVLCLSDTHHVSEN